ncbi:CU044_5270 family protein [Streptomyces sp. NPDC049627]|uniref:CU044_5270 family protein n=1 Tax=Streptomyces sp. NPDC049627 TaxID=3365595 RepID=UPI0037890116
MDELTTVREWGTATAPDGPSDQARAAARARLRTAIDEESRSAASRGRVLSRRVVFRASLAGLSAAAVGVAVVVARGDEDDDTPRLSTVSATEVLRRAAQRTRAEGSDLPVPRNDQYFYTQTYITRTPVKGGKTRTWTDESWMSVDGSKPSLREEYGKIHHDPPLGEHEVRWPPTVYSKLQTMPTDPDELLKQFRRVGGDSPKADMLAFMEGCMLMMGPRVMPPGLQAGAFEALSKLPRIRLDFDDVDVVGRSAVGVSYPEANWTFLFDRRTYDYLGLRTKGSVPRKVGKDDWVQSGWYWETRTLQDIRVVDRIGQHA